MKFTLYSNKLTCKSILVYLLDINPDVYTVDFVDPVQLMRSMYVDWERDYEIQMFGIGCGVHRIKFQDKCLQVTVNQYIGNRDMVCTNDYHNEIIKEVVIEGDQVNTDLIQQLSTTSLKHVENRFKDLTQCKKKHIKKYIYVANEGYWDLMNNTQTRNMETLFLKKGQKEELFDFVKDFVSTKTQQDYERFSIPYKANILLYGKPGTGKTSTILSIASELDMNIGLIPISRGLDDTKLIHAMNSVKKNDCKVIVFEDIDCLFVERKEHDAHKNSLTMSGLLNCLDGLFRNEGIIVFMTANNISALDEALLRCSRIDFKMYYDYADEHQTRECFQFYFPSKPEQEFALIYDAIKYKQYTISMLQQFFFKHRKKDNLTEHIQELIDIIQGTEQDVSEAKHLYM